MTKILLISEELFKEETPVSDNLYGKYLMPAIRESQDIYLSQILGENLLDEIYYRVLNNQISGDYKTLLDSYIQPYLIYQTQVNLVPIMNVKLANIGSVIANDEHIVTLSKSDIDNFAQNVQYKADWYARRMQEFLLSKRTELGLEDCDCDKIKANLDSAASIGIWVGGIRGKILNGGCC